MAQYIFTKDFTTGYPEPPRHNEVKKSFKKGDIVEGTIVDIKTGVYAKYFLINVDADKYIIDFSTNALTEYNASTSPKTKIDIIKSFFTPEKIIIGLVITGIILKWRKVI